MRQVISFTFFAVVFVSLAAGKQPNVVVFLSDDQGWGDLSVNGNANLDTPNIDALAREGARFDRFYVCPVCSPTRAEFLTGRYYQRGGVYSTSSGGERLDLDESTIADAFKAAGYVTGAFGKWHNGTQYPYHPTGRGFETFYGFCSGHWGNYFSPMLDHNGAVIRGDGYCIDDFTDKALRFIESAGDKPFFVFLPYNTPHSPMQVPDEDWMKFEGAELKMRHRKPEAENVQHTRAALAMCENIDRNVGRVLTKLDELGKSGNTIVVYFCDNGPNGNRWNGGMKGKKGSTDEGGVRSPLHVHWPGHIKAGTLVETLGSAIDLYPTLAELAGVAITAEKPLDGVSLAGALQGRPAGDLSERMVFSSWGNNFSVRTARFRLGSRGGLFDIQADPGQAKDVSSKHPEVYQRLSDALSAHKKAMTKELRENGKRPFVIAHPDHRYTWIPARDGKGHGNLQRSSRHPNDSFFENWVDEKDHITWEVEVAADGRYKATIYYTCGKDSIGSLVGLSCGSASVNAKVTEAHDPPLQGAEHDRVPRTESYVKDFKPLGMGVMKLEKGVATLKLHAVEKPGAELIDFRLLLLERVD